MKKIVSFILIFAIILTSTASFATITDKLMNHWADSLINRSFVAYYFSYLARDKFQLFSPNEPISEGDFTLSLSALFKDYGYELIHIGGENHVSRGDMVTILGTRLMEIGINEGENVNLPFKDINTMSSDSIELLRVLFNNKIIVGDPDSSFNPNRELKQVEAIIILQRVREVLEDMNTIAFNTLGIVQSYSAQEEIIIKEENEAVMVTITKQFPTPGYSMAVNRILRAGNGYRIYFNITAPPGDSILPQVITYKTITLELDKDQLTGPPYNFILDGFNNVRTN